MEEQQTGWQGESMQVVTTRHEERAMERRSSYRHEVSVPCTVRDEDGNALACDTENIGIGGALLLAGDARDVGTSLGLDIHFPWANTVTTAATIRRSVDRLPGQAKLAIRFDHTVHGSRLQLKHAIELKWTSHEVAVKASALIMVDDEAIREQMSDAVAALKVRPLTADMPDAALWHLTGEGNAITSVIVDEELFGDQTLRWFSFLRASMSRTCSWPGQPGARESWRSGQPWGPNAPGYWHSSCRKLGCWPWAGLWWVWPSPRSVSTSLPGMQWTPTLHSGSCSPWTGPFFSSSWEARWWRPWWRASFQD